MIERDTFIRAIADNPDDDNSRRAFAAWLDAHDEHERAELICVQLELEQLRNGYGGRRATELREREHQLLQDHPWLSDLPQGWDDRQTGLSLRFRRGFPDLLRGPARSLLLFGSAIRARQPTIRRVVIHRLAGWGTRLAACAGLDGLAELELACWYPDADLEALARSPHLAGLRVLVLWLGRQEVGSHEDLCRIAAGARALTNLRELVLFDPLGARQQELESLVAWVNRRTVRGIARYEYGDPGRLPFGGLRGWGGLLAGWLPDGHIAVAELDRGPDADHDTIPDGLTVTLYDDRGRQTGGVIQVPLPPELATITWAEADNLDGRYVQHLRDALGFEPGLVRVPPSALGDRLSLDGYFENWAACGSPDDPDADSLHGPNGIGGTLYGYLRTQECVVGYRPRSDKREDDRGCQEMPETPAPEDDRRSEGEIPF